MVNYGIPNLFKIQARPVSGTGDMQVHMIAKSITPDGDIVLQAPIGLWEDGYLYHLQHTAGLESEAAAEITALLKGGTITNFEVTCFTEQLHAVGFISPKASFLDLGRQDAE